jgi:hypothetical protein
MDSDLIVCSSSEQFILHHQLAALCESLRFLLHAGREPGPRTYRHAKKLLDDALALTSGRCVTPPPQIEETDSVADLLVTCENLRAVALAMLSPEECDAARKIGYISSP